MTTQEGNKIINIFRGLSLGMEGYVNDYHLNWNSLMPVVEKISRIEFDRDEQELPFGGTETIIYTHYPRTFGMLNNATGKPMFRYNCGQVFEADTLIEAAWQATVDFIYNAKTQTP